MDDLISRADAIRVISGLDSSFVKYIEELPSAQTDNDMIHLQKEQAYLQGWEDGREALRKEIWEDGRDRLD